MGALRYLVVLLLATTAMAGAVSAEPVAVNPWGDAEADYVAVSGTGSANGQVAASGTGPARGIVAASVLGPSTANALCAGLSCASGVAVSVAGDASQGNVAVSGLGEAEGGILCPVFPLCLIGLVAVGGAGADEAFVTASLLGDAGRRISLLAVSGTGNAGSTSTAVAASGTGDANACRDDLGPLVPCTAASGTGDAFACSNYGGSFPLRYCTAASGTGDATSNWVAASVAGDATTPYPTSEAAVSVLGDATSQGTGTSYAVLGQCNAQDCVDASVNEDANGYWLAVSGTGDASGSYAISALGDAKADCHRLPLTTYNRVLGCTAVSGFGDAWSPIVAGSVFGNAYSGCIPSDACPSASVMGTAQGGAAPTSACAVAGDSAGSDFCMDPRETIHLTLA